MNGLSDVRRKQNEPTGTKVNQTNQDNDKDKEKDKDKDKDKECVCRGAAPPVTPASAAAARAHTVPPSWEEAEAIELHRRKEAKRV